MEENKTTEEEAELDMATKPERCLVESCLKLYPSDIKLDSDSFVTDMRSTFLINATLLPNRADPAIDLFLYRLTLDAETHIPVAAKKVLSQEIKIDYFDITFGRRFYFWCPDCGTRHTVLHLKPDGLKFACRDCHGLKYELTTIHRGRVLNELRYIFNRKAKLNLLNTGKVRVSYAGKFTKRANRIMELAEIISPQAEPLRTR